MADTWDEASFAGITAARTRRWARMTPQQRLEWLEAVLREADRAGVLVQVRRRRQDEALKAWENPGGH